MHTLPKNFFNWSTTVLYMTVCPVFFFVFVLVYEPLRLRPYLDMGRDLYAMNLAICFSISLVVISGLRVAFHYMKNARHLTWAHFIVWCMFEVLVASMFMSLYLGLMSRDLPFLSVLLTCVGFSYLIFIIPYVVLTLAFTIGSHREREKMLMARDEEDNSLIRFMDIYQRPKLIISPSAVLYIEARENYVMIHYMEGGRQKEFELRATMSSLEEVAARYSFVRCQRSFYVNPAHVTVLRKETGGLIFAELDIPGLPSIPVSKRYYEELSKLL
ncbi:MAG: LytTR family transcriptional regulator [Bacteroidales bacterium]|nr:LytTR family transcriptional regulator [Bacteroidales bacterium]